MEEDEIPYLKKDIGEIVENDTKLFLIGRISSVISENECIISDETGEITVSFADIPPSPFGLKEINMIKILGRYDTHLKKITVDYHEDFSDYNFDLHKKVYKLKKSIKF